MQDILLDISRNPQARKWVKMLGLPIPMPQDLRRGKGAWEERPLFDQDVVVYASAGSAITQAVAETLAEAGAQPHVVGDDKTVSLFQGPGEAFGRLPQAVTLEELSSIQPHALVFDASGLSTPQDLHQLYAFFHPILRGVKRCGRLIVLGRPPAEQTRVGAAAVQSALEGFVRSLAKEVGRRGATAQMLYVADGAEDRLAGPLRFFLSARSAYVTGQPITVSANTPAVENESPWNYSLEGKVALVTGAARGIGAATAQRLAEEGARVVCLDRPDDDGPTSKLAREIGGQVLLADVTAPDAVETIQSFLKEEMGGVDVVVHNAGITRDKTLARMKPEQWDLTVQVNLDAVLRITEGLIETDTFRPNGRLICLSSVSGIAGNMGQTNYAAAKSGVVGLVRSLASVVAEKGITVNAIAPGFIETRMTAAMPTVIREVARRMNNLSQGGRPVDVAEAITFLALPHTHGVTGQVLRVCGGALIGA